MIARLPFLFLLALLFGMQLVFWQEAQDAFNPVQLLWAKVLIPLSVLSLFLTRWPGWARIAGSFSSRAALLFIAWLLLRGGFSPNPQAALKIALEYSAYALLFFVPLVLDAGERRKALMAFFSASVVAALYGFFQHFGVDPWRWSTNFAGRPLGTLGNPNFFGGHLVLAWGLCLGFAIKWRRPWCYACLALLTLVQVYSRTVGVWLGMAMAAAALGAWLFAGRMEMGRKALVGILIAFLAVSAALAANWGRLKTEKKASVTNRQMMWKVAAGIWKEKPLQGAGLTEYRRRFPDVQAGILEREKDKHWNYVVTWLPHQNFLYLLCELGLIGLGLFLAAWAGATRAAWGRLGDRNPEALAAALATFGMFGVSLLNTFSNIPPTAMGFWFLLGLMAQGRAQARPLLEPRKALALAAAAAVLWGLFAGTEVAGHRLIRQGLREKKKNELRLAALHLKKAADFRIQEFTPQTLVGVWYELGEVYRSGGALKESAAAYQNDLAENPFAPETHNMLGANLGQLGSNAEAAAHLEQAIRLSPGYTAALLNLGIARVSQGNVSGAAKAWQDILAIEPGNKDALAYLEQLKKMKPR